MAKMDAGDFEKMISLVIPVYNEEEKPAPVDGPDPAGDVRPEETLGDYPGR